MSDNRERFRLVIATLRQTEDSLNAVRHTTKDKEIGELAKGLFSLSYGLRVALDILPERIERLHQKIDRIEKKIGSV